MYTKFSLRQYDTSADIGCDFFFLRKKNGVTNGQVIVYDIFTFSFIFFDAKQTRIIY